MSNVPSAFNLAKLFRTTPSNAENCPAIRIAPFAWITMSNTDPSTAAPGSNVASSVPFGFTRTMDRRLAPSNALNEPPSKLAPFACTAIANTIPSIPATGANVPSTVPSAFSRTMPLAATPLNVENAPPTRILDGPPPAPGTIATASSEPSDPNPASKVTSTEPLAFKRATCRRVSPPAAVKSPTTTTLPSGCSAIAATVPFRPWPGSNETSGNPVASSRATPLRGRPLIAANPPATKILPSG
ncbi:hypothetical protein LBMAG56_02470 [Verrucomicrobiota bacterium]|nr:hypothetical protein LBMAG56_02470 [Verrucomicrobiota bacterium]